MTLFVDYSNAKMYLKMTDQLNWLGLAPQAQMSSYAYVRNCTQTGLQ